MKNVVYRRLLWAVWIIGCCSVSLQAQSAIDVMRGRNAVPKPDTLATPKMEQPKFPGGQNALMIYIADHVKYPKSLRKKRYNAGQITVKFMIQPDGKVSDIQVMSRPTPPEVAEEMSDYVTSVMKAFSRMPRWQPARVNGSPITYPYTLPFQVDVNQ